MNSGLTERKAIAMRVPLAACPPVLPSVSYSVVVWAPDRTTPAAQVSPPSQVGSDTEPLFYANFAPILRTVSWYQMVLAVQPDPGDGGKLQVRALTKMEGVQIVPAHVEIATDYDSTNPLVPVKLRLAREEHQVYQDSTRLRIDDITVVKLESY